MLEEQRGASPATKLSLSLGQDAPSSWTNPDPVTLSLACYLWLPFPLLHLSVTGDPALSLVPAVAHSPAIHPG